MNGYIWNIKERYYDRNSKLASIKWLCSYCQARCQAELPPSKTPNFCINPAWRMRYPKTKEGEELDENNKGVKLQLTNTQYS